MSANVLRSLHKSCKFTNIGSMKAGAVLSNRTNIMDFVVIDTDFRVDKGNGFLLKLDMNFDYLFRSSYMPV